MCIHYGVQGFVGVRVEGRRKESKVDGIERNVERLCTEGHRADWCAGEVVS